MYFNFDRESINAQNQEDRTDFYHNFLREFVDKVKKTGLKDDEEFLRFTEDFDDDPSKIYRDDIFDGNDFPVMMGTYNLAANMSRMFKHYEWNDSHPQFLFNISVADNFPKDPVKVQDQSIGVSIPDRNGLESAASYAVSQLLELGSSGSGIIQTIALPGWCVDVLTDSWANQPWMRGLWAEGAILEELSYKQILEV